MRRLHFHCELCRRRQMPCRSTQLLLRLQLFAQSQTPKMDLAWPQPVCSIQCNIAISVRTNSGSPGLRAVHYCAEATPWISFYTHVSCTWEAANGKPPSPCLP